MTRKQKKLLTRIIVSLVLFGVGFLLKDWWQAGFMLAAWLSEKATRLPGKPLLDGAALALESTPPDGAVLCCGAL